MKPPWEWTENDIRGLIANQVEESLTLEYKACDALGHNTSVATTQSGRSYALNDIGLYQLNPDGTVTKLTTMSHDRYGWMMHMCAGPGETLYFTADKSGGTLAESATKRVPLGATATYMVSLVRPLATIAADPPGEKRHSR